MDAAAEWKSTVWGRTNDEDGESSLHTVRFGTEPTSADSEGKKTSVGKGGGVLREWP